MALRNIFDYALATGAGSQTINVNVEQDISRAQAITIVLNLTGAATDAGDTLNVRFQETPDDGVTWDTRARFEQFLGTAVVSAAAPERRIAVLHARTQLQTTEEYYEPSGSAGATEIAAGTVINGPFYANLHRGSASLTGQQIHGNRYRVNLAVVDANSNGGFSGNIRIWSDVPEGPINA